ncbi:MAG: ferritin family protein [Nitrospirota bacterium]
MEDITLREIIDYARINEENSKRFYSEAAEKATVENVRAFLAHLVKEEQKHIDHLNDLDKTVDKGGAIPKPHEVVKPLGYAEFLGNVKLDDTASYQDVLKAAMAKEKEALESYKKYAALSDDPKAKELFLFLAAEESVHLRGFEEKYDDFMREIENN